LLRQVLGPRLVAGEHRRPSYSLWLAPEDAEGRSRLHLLYRHGELIARSRHADHLTVRLVAHLGAHVGLDRLVPLPMVAMVTASRAVLVAHEVRARLA
jgi:hypothetical protein